MLIEELLLDQQSDVISAIRLLEKSRCKIIYVTDQNKIVGAVSDGDVRRYVLKNGNLSVNVMEIATKDPWTVTEYSMEECNELFSSSQLYSIPLVNLNHEIIGIVFRDGTVVRKRTEIGVPVVINAGGKGTRLHPYTKILPKALIPIGDSPISEIIFDHFYDCGCSDYYMILNHKGNMIKAYYNSNDKPFQIKYVEERMPLGTGGGLSLLKGKITSDFFFTNCDTIIDADYSMIYEIHKKQRNLITIVSAEKRIQIPYGVIQYDTNKTYKGMDEKPQYQLNINTGMYVVNPKVLEEIPEDTSMDFTEIIEACRKKGENIGCYSIGEAAFLDMGQMEEMEQMKVKLRIR